MKMRVNRLKNQNFKEPSSLNKNIKISALTGAIFFIALFVFLPISAAAQASLGIEIGTATGLGTADLKDIVVNIVRIILGFLGIIAVIILLYGGFTWMTAAGNEDKVEKAKKIIINAAIGLAIILASYAIVMYVIRQFGDVMFGGGPGPGPGPYSGYEGHLGALGGGILESIYPERGATDVPRNTLIMVRFKEAMNPASIIDTSSGIGCPVPLPAGLICGNLTLDVLGKPNVIVENNSDGNSFLNGNQVTAMTYDNKDFVFDPVVYLGSENAYSNYTVYLTTNIQKGDGTIAFTTNFSWSFEVSNVIDLMPPRVVSITPEDGETDVYKNSVVQIDFNEAISVITVTSTNVIIGYTDAAGVPQTVSGTLGVSNRFRTITFISNADCLDDSGVPVINSCGLTPKCLPGNVEITVTAKTPDPAIPLSGIMDAAGNGLDGNGNGEIEPGDHFVSAFTTNNIMYLEPPVIEAVQPVGEGVPKNSLIKANFSSKLKSDTVNSENATIFNYFCSDPAWIDHDEFPPSGSLCYPEGGFVVYREAGAAKDKAVIRVYSPYLEGLETYNPRLTSGIKDTYQNCFYPSDCTGPDCP